MKSKATFDGGGNVRLVAHARLLSSSLTKEHLKMLSLAAQKSVVIFIMAIFYVQSYEHCNCQWWLMLPLISAILFDIFSYRFAAG